MHRVWGWDFGDLSTVTVHVRRLRGKVEDDPARPRLIQTVWGVGYRFDPAGRRRTDRVRHPSHRPLRLRRRRRRRPGGSRRTAADPAAFTDRVARGGGGGRRPSRCSRALAVAWAMFLSPHDLSVVTTVVAMAAVVSLATALLLGRWVRRPQPQTDRRRPLVRRRRRLRGPHGPVRPPNWTRSAVSWRPPAPGSRNPGNGNAPWRPPGANWSPGSRTTCVPRWPACAPCPRPWRTASPGPRPLPPPDPHRGGTPQRHGRRPLRAVPHPRRHSPLARPGSPLRPGRRRPRGRGPARAGARRSGWSASAVAAVPVEVDGKGDEPGPGQPAGQRDPPHARRRHGRGRRRALARRRGGIRDRRLRRHPRGGPAARLRHRLARHPRPYPPAGAGLGLAIVRGIVEAHRGRATVRNIPGRLPLRGDPAGTGG